MLIICFALFYFLNEKGIIRVVICGCTLKGAAEKDEETQPIPELFSVFYLVLLVYTCCYRSV